MLLSISGTATIGGGVESWTMPIISVVVVSVVISVVSVGLHPSQERNRKNATTAIAANKIHAFFVISIFSKV